MVQKLVWFNINITEGILNSTDARHQITQIWNHAEWREVTYIEDRSGAEGTPWREQKMIIAFTVRQTVTFKEVARAQRFFAMNANEMFWMPEARQCSNHLDIIIIVTASLSSSSSGNPFFAANFAKFRGTICEIPQHYYPQIPYILWPVGVVVLTDNTSKYKVFIVTWLKALF